MQLQLVRNATLRLTYADRKILVDPYFAPRHSRDPLVGKSRNPMVDLPMSVEEILDGVEIVIVSHLHFDHFDPVAQDAIPKSLPLICQPTDAEKIRAMGFEQVTPLADVYEWQGITLTRTEGQHGTGVWLERMGSVMGFVLDAMHEPMIYWAGDTILVDAVKHTIETTQPDVIITHSAGAAFESKAPIVMDAEQTIEVCNLAQSAAVIAVHMETLDHATVTRADLRAAASSAGIQEDQLLIPQDGETLELT